MKRLIFLMFLRAGALGTYNESEDSTFLTQLSAEEMDQKLEVPIWWADHKNGRQK